MLAIVFLLFAACGDNIRPDADARTPDDVNATADATSDAVMDASIDAPADASTCFQERQVQCDNELMLLCIPWDGCVTYTCHGVTQGYCHFTDAGVP